MKAAEAGPLTLVRAASALPADSTGAAAWREAAVAGWAAAEPSQYGGLTSLMFGQTGCDPAAACIAANGAGAPQRFRDAGAQTQCDLASQALQAVLAQQDIEATRRCRLAVYGTASVDEHFFQSTISRLAASHGFTALPHFGLAQLQGATLPAAAEIIDAMLHQEGDAALFIGADKWPLPFPRRWGDLSMLGDGAAALWFARGPAPGLRYLGGHQSSTAPVVGGGRRGDRGLPRIDSEALLDAAAHAITACLAAHALAPRDIGVWVASGLQPALERKLRQRLGAGGGTLIEPDPKDGYLGAAATPALLAGTLHRSADGEFAAGSLVLSWGASLGGGIGVALWRVATPVEH